MPLVANIPQVNEGPLFAEFDMATDFYATGSTVCEASTIFYGIPATLGNGESKEEVEKEGRGSEGWDLERKGKKEGRGRKKGGR
ncbi:hypothetical protein ACH5RR_040127 [Cinchona calisaya]|uniref:Uncharacterized protein n=1 Tax=Cinchona calisaya TaxID=153742 RepID=A0ABD2XV49_9GENT